MHEDTEKLLIALDKWVDNKTMFSTSLNMINEKLSKGKLNREVEAAALSVFRKNTNRPFILSADTYLGKYQDRVIGS